MEYSRPSSRKVDKPWFESSFDISINVWDNEKSRLLNRFPSSGKLSLSYNFEFLPTDTQSRPKSLAAVRLQRLEDPGTEERMTSRMVSQQEYTQALKEVKDDIAQAWLQGERVSALRHAARVAKLLGDTSIPQFYPTLFVLVADVMDTLGSLVWHRIREKSEADGKDDWSIEAVSKTAKDTCRNWFFKIGSVQELLPRLYLEMAILRCMLYLDPHPPISTIQRMATMARGLSDPMVAGYARLYLAKQGLACAPPEGEGTGRESALGEYTQSLLHVGRAVPSSFGWNPRGYLMTALEDSMRVYHRVLAGDFDAKIRDGGVTSALYLDIIDPPIQFLVQCLLRGAPHDTVVQVVERLSSDSKVNVLSSTIMHHLLRTMPPGSVASMAARLAHLCTNATEGSIKKYSTLMIIGEVLSEIPPGEDADKSFAEIWKAASSFSDQFEYLSIAGAFTDFVLHNTNKETLGWFMASIETRLAEKEPTPATSSVLRQIICDTATWCHSVSQLLDTPGVNSMLSALRGEALLSASQHILSHFNKVHTQVSGAKEIHFLTSLCSDIHGCIDAFTADSQLRMASRLLSHFICKADFGDDLSSNLSFLVDCRAKLYNLDAVKVATCQVANRLAVRTVAQCRGELSSAAMEFIRACVAFSEVTLPAVHNNTRQKLQMYLASAEAALLTGLVGHAESALRTAILLLQDLSLDNAVGSAEVDAWVVDYVRNFSSFLIVMPANPEKGALYLQNGLVKVLASFHWSPPGLAHAEALLALLMMSSNLALQSLPYHVCGFLVDSNDSLFYGDSRYLADLSALATSLVEDIVSIVSKAPHSKHKVSFALKVHQYLQLQLPVEIGQQSEHREFLGNIVPFSLVPS